MINMIKLFFNKTREKGRSPYKYLFTIQDKGRSRQIFIKGKIEDYLPRVFKQLNLFIEDLEIKKEM